MGKDFRVGVVKDSERGKEFMEVFGTVMVFVKSPIPKFIITPEKEKALAYFLDIDLLTKKQRKNLVRHLSKKFKQSIAEVEKDLETKGIPVLKKDTIKIIENPQKWLG